MKQIEGYKTYIIAIAISMLGVANHLGYVDDATFKMILALLGSGGLMTLKAGMNRTERKSEAALNGVTYLAGNFTQSKVAYNQAKTPPVNERVQGVGITSVDPKGNPGKKY